MASSSRGRGRPPKDSGRMDAALLKLLPIFPKEKIINTITSLLKVYGKEAGWFFVEDNGSYQPVIEALLSEQEEEKEKEEDSCPQQQQDRDYHVSPQQLEPVSHVNQGEDTMMDESLRRTNPNHVSPQQVDPNNVNQEEESTIDESLGETDSPRRVRSPSFGYLSESVTDDDSDDHSSP